MTLEEHTKALDVEVDNYQNTVMALRAFANEILWDDTKRVIADGSVHCGRRFTTSRKNKHTKNGSVTPDLAVIPAKNTAVVAEAKFGYEKSPADFLKRVNETVEQLEKYDDDLSGWPSRWKHRQPTTHDLVLLVNYEDAPRVRRELDERCKSGRFGVSRCLAIVSCATISRAGGGEWPTLELRYGKLSDSDKTTKLENTIPIHPDKLALNPLISLVEMYDCPPPLPTMMDLVQRAVTTHLTPDEQETYNIDGQVDKTVKIKDLCQWLSDYAFPKSDERDPYVPKECWLTPAIEGLIQIQWAEAGKDNNTFVYRHRRARRGCNKPLSRFVEACAKQQTEVEEKALGKQRKLEEKSARDRERLKQEFPLLAPQIDKGQKL
jgi:hypothetical protein